MHIAAENGNVAIAQWLLDNSTILEPGIDGTTPLSIAQQKGHREIVELDYNSLGYAR